MRRLRDAGLMAGVLMLGLLCGGPAAAAHTIRVEPEPVFALPSHTLGCGGATTPAAGLVQAPLTVSTVAGQVAETVNVCFGSRGPYPFIIDTGSGESTIDAGLAARLHLTKVGPATEFEGVGCTGTARNVSVGAWSLEGIALAGQDLTAATLPQIGGKGEPDGLLGSDVLSRFAGVRLDFKAGTLTLQGAESPAKTSGTTVHGPTGAPLPVSLIGTGASTTVPLTVQFQPGAISMNVKLRFGHGAAHTFTVDTGSSQSVVANTLARSSHLASSDVAERQSTVCSYITVPLVHSGPWSVDGLRLHQQLIGSTNFGPIAAGGLSGLLGSDQLIRYGWVVFDYQGGRLILG
ncbi:MAG TPA: aspartyl protease family protein [Acidimicrobiales bacterium]|jgi:hypothetical protein